MVHVIRQALTIALAIVAVAVVVVVLSDHFIVPPDNAEVYIDVDNLTYASPPCAVGGRTDREFFWTDPLDEPSRESTLQSFVISGTMAEVRQDRRYHRDETCNKAGGFEQRES